MHTTVQSGTRALSQLRSATTLRDRLGPEEFEEVLGHFDHELANPVPPPRFSTSSSKGGRTRLSSFDLSMTPSDEIEVKGCDMQKTVRQKLSVSPDAVVATKGGAAVIPKRSPQKQSVSGDEGAGPMDLSLGLALSIAYASFIFCRTFFSVTQAAMKADPQIKLTDARANNIITSFGVAFGLAKFPAGIIVNSAPPKAALLVFMVSTALIVTLFSRSEGYEAMFVIALVNAIPQAGAYPAVTKLVCAGFAPQHHSSVFALVSIGSRVGQVAVSLVLGEVLRRSGDWRTAQQVAPVVVLSAALLVLLLTHGKLPNSKGSAGKKVGAKGATQSPTTATGEEGAGSDPLSVRLARLGCNPRFWLVNFSASMLLVSKGFDTYAVRFIADICDAAHPSKCKLATPGAAVISFAANATGATCLCKSYAPQVTAGVSLGIVTSLLFGSYVYERLRGGHGRWLRALFIVSLCALNVFVAGLLYLYAGSVLSLDSSHNFGETNAPYSGTGSLGEGAFRPLFGEEWQQGRTLCTLGVLLFFLGFSAGYPFYVPQSLFAVEFGAADAATVVGCGECLQSVFAAAFILTGQRYAVVDDVTDWVKICSFISGAAAIGFVLMVLFMYESMRAADKRRGKTEKAA